MNCSVRDDDGRIRIHSSEWLDSCLHRGSVLQCVDRGHPRGRSSLQADKHNQFMAVQVMLLPQSTNPFKARLQGREGGGLTTGADHLAMSIERLS